MKCNILNLQWFLIVLSAILIGRKADANKESPLIVIFYSADDTSKALELARVLNSHLSDMQVVIKKNKLDKKL
jgi:hypothetical protein